MLLSMFSQECVNSHYIPHSSHTVTQKEFIVVRKTENVHGLYIAIYHNVALHNKVFIKCI